jgi:erythromycin esterase-like protein
MVRRRVSFVDESPTPELLDDLRNLAMPLRDADDLDPLIARIGNARVVMLGEASHGTREFYTWRTALTRRLIEERGFSFVAVEGDWPDSYRINRFVKGYPGTPARPAEALDTFRRWPTWMWANEEVRDLIGWFRGHNDRRPEKEKVGFYGLDVYSLWDSLHEVMAFLRKRDPGALGVARRAFRCFEPYGEEAQEYARATLYGNESCRDEVIDLLTRVRAEASSRNGEGSEAQFVAEQNALVVKNAEAYYRTMVRANSESWNIRDRHMAETLRRLLNHHGRHAKAIVWEHNTHIGDARFTDMSDEGMVNIGQLARDEFGKDDTVLVGFGTHRGTVIAGDYWDAPWSVMNVPPARVDSWEDVLHHVAPRDMLFVFGPDDPPELAEWRGHRAIGVVYRPRHEQYGNYVPTVLSRRYDAFLYIDHSSAVRPLFGPTEAELPEEAPETYPTGV